MTNLPVLSPDKVIADLREAIKSCLLASGRPVPALRDDEPPLTSIPGFDSLCAIEVTVDLQQKLGIHLEDNVFIKTTGDRPKPRTFIEIVEAVVRAAN